MNKENLMFPQAFSRIKLLVVLLTLAVLSLSPAAEANDRRIFIHYDLNGGYFEQVAGDQWREFIGNGGMGDFLYFREVERTPEYVKLYDQSRALWIRIHANDSYILFPGSGGWKPLYRGRWN
jgi:hypothetical protein